MCGLPVPDFVLRGAWVEGCINMANTEEQVLGQQDEEGTEAMKDEGDKDPERDISQPSLHESVGTDKPNVAPGEVMSLRECCRDAFGKMTEYLRGELSGKDWIYHCININSS